MTIFLYIYLCKYSQSINKCKCPWCLVC